MFYFCHLVAYFCLHMSAISVNAIAQSKTFFFISMFWKSKAKWEILESVPTPNFCLLIRLYGINLSEKSKPSDLLWSPSLTLQHENSIMSEHRFPISSLEEWRKSACDILCIYQAESFIDTFPSVFGFHGLFLVVGCTTDVA